MATYQVINKATEQVVYTYDASAPIEWVGMDFTNFNHVLVPDPTTDPAVYPMRIKVIAFRRRFTMVEQAMILTLAQTDMMVAAYLRGLDAEIAAGSSFDLSDTTTPEYAGVQYLATKSVTVDGVATPVLTEARAAAILTTVPTGDEVPV